MRVNANTHTPCRAAERGHGAESEDAAQAGQGPKGPRYSEHEGRPTPCSKSQGAISCR